MNDHIEENEGGGGEEDDRLELLFCFLSVDI